MSNTELIPLCELARMCGRSWLHTQGQGGNVSLVSEDTLWVKRSGARLKDTSLQDFVALPRQKVRELFHDFLDSDHEAEADTELERRYSRNGSPSVESWFHALLGPVTAHAHLVSAVAATSVKPTGDQNCPELDFSIFSATIPYAPPGFFLAREIVRLLPDPVPVQGVLMLRNHGVVIWGSSTGEVLQLLDVVDQHCRNSLKKGVLFPGWPDFFTQEDLLQAVPVSPRSDMGDVQVELVGRLWEDAKRPEYLQAPLTPDHALHFGHGLRSVAGTQRVFGHLTMEKERLFYHAVNRQVLNAAVELVSSQLAAMHLTGGHLCCLNSGEVDQLLAWGAGKYSGVGK